MLVRNHQLFLLDGYHDQVVLLLAPVGLQQELGKENYKAISTDWNFEELKVSF